MGLERNTVDGQDIEPASVTTESLDGTFPSELRAESAGEIVATVDPADTTTPVQDAIDAINTDGDGSGTIDVPGGNIADASPGLSGMADIIAEGEGIVSTTIEMTDTASPGLPVTAGSDLRAGGFRDLTFSGSDASARTTTEPAFLLDAAVFDVEMDRVNLSNWVREFHFNTGDIYSSEWGLVVSNPTEEVLVHDAAARSPGWSVDHWFVSPDAVVTGQALFDINTGTMLDVTTMNAGSNSGRLVHIADTANDQGAMSIGTLNFESSQTISEVFYLGNQRHGFKLGQMMLGGGVTVDQAVNVGGGGYNYIGFIRDGNNTVNTDYIVVTADTLNAAPTITEMDSAVVTDSSGVTLSQPVACLGDLTTVS